MTAVTLNEICELIVDCPHSTAYDEGKGYPLVRTPNIGNISTEKILPMK